MFSFTYVHSKKATLHHFLPLNAECGIGISICNLLSRVENIFSPFFEAWTFSTQDWKENIFAAYPTLRNKKSTSGNRSVIILETHRSLANNYSLRICFPSFSCRSLYWQEKRQFHKNSVQMADCKPRETLAGITKLQSVHSLGNRSCCFVVIYEVSDGFLPVYRIKRSARMKFTFTSFKYPVLRDILLFPR